jgi:hypothetical protein
VGVAGSVVLEVLLQLLALFWAPSPMRGRSVDLVVVVGVAAAIAITTALQLGSALSSETRSRSEIAAALLQVRPAMLLWRSATAEQRNTAQLRSTTAGLEQLSPELHRLSMAETYETPREVGAAPGGVPDDDTAAETSGRRRQQQEANVNASVGTHALLRTVPVASLLALRWWAAFARCIPACGSDDAAVLQDDGGAVTLIAFSLFSSATTLSLILTRCCAGELRARANREPRTDPVSMPGLTFAVLLAGVAVTLWTSVVVRLATFSLYVVVFGDGGALTGVVVSSVLTICFFQYEKSLGAFLGTIPGTSGLVPVPDADEPVEDSGATNDSRVCARSWRRRWWLAQNAACQQAGVCLAGMVCPAVDVDLSHPPLSRGSALLIAIRISELAFVWVVSTGGTNGAPVPSGPVATEQQPQESREDQPAVIANIPPDAANILANCLLACFVMLILMRLIAYRSRPTVPSRIAAWWPAEWLAGIGRLLLVVVAMVCVLVALGPWLSAVLTTVTETAATPYVPLTPRLYLAIHPATLLSRYDLCA